MATVQKSGKPRAATLDRSAHGISFRIRIVGNQCAVVLVDIPTDVALAAVGSKNCPLFVSVMHLAHDAFATVFKSHRGPAPVKGVRPCVSRVLQHGQHQMAARSSGSFSSRSFAVRT
jgi:hypothetical protein